jgi:thiol-disulfide isomerase/thioredoxin
MRLLVAVLAGLAGLAVLLAGGCSTGGDATATGSQFQFVSPDGKTELFYDGADRKPIPDLSGESLMEEGKRLRVADFAGKVVVINIWGAWCPPCRAEAPELQEVYDRTRDSGVQVLGIDVRDEQRTTPQDFVRDTGLTYPSIYDPPARSLLSLKGYPRAVVPSTIVLDRSHRVAAIYLHDLLAEDLLPLVQRLAAEQ